MPKIFSTGNLPFEVSSKVDYYQGEDRVAEKWPQELLRKPGKHAHS